MPKHKLLMLLVAAALPALPAATCNPEPSPPPTPVILTVDGRVPTCAEACARWLELPGCESIGQLSPQGMTCAEVCHVIDDEFPGEYRTACVVAAQSCAGALNCQATE